MGLCFWGTSTSRLRSLTLVKQTPETDPETDPSFCLSSWGERWETHPETDPRNNIPKRNFRLILTHTHISYPSGLAWWEVKWWGLWGEGSVLTEGRLGPGRRFRWRCFMPHMSCPPAFPISILPPGFGNIQIFPSRRSWRHTSRWLRDSLVLVHLDSSRWGFAFAEGFVLINSVSIVSLLDLPRCSLILEASLHTHKPHHVAWHGDEM